MATRPANLRPRQSGSPRSKRGESKPGPQTQAQIAASGTPLRSSDASFELLFSQNPHPIYVHDRETLQFLEVNDAAVTAYGYSREELLRMRITDIRPAGDSPEVVEAIRTGGKSLKSSGHRLDRRRNGELFEVEITTQALSFAGRDAVLVVA